MVFDEVISYYVSCFALRLLVVLKLLVRLRQVVACVPKKMHIPDILLWVLLKKIVIRPTDSPIFGFLFLYVKKRRSKRSLREKNGTGKKVPSYRRASETDVDSIRAFPFKWELPLITRLVIIFRLNAGFCIEICMHMRSEFEAFPFSWKILKSIDLKQKKRERISCGSIYSWDLPSNISRRDFCSQSNFVTSIYLMDNNAFRDFLRMTENRKL